MFRGEQVGGYEREGGGAYVKVCTLPEEDQSRGFRMRVEKGRI